jgi:GntR family transcriptional regulator
MQLVEQVQLGVRLGLLREGDQLPTVKDVVAQLGINPNTVMKAYRRLEHEGLVASRRGQGTFVATTAPKPSANGQANLRRELERWIAAARRAGLDDGGITGLFHASLQAGASSAA